MATCGRPGFRWRSSGLRSLGPRNGVPATRASRGAPRGDERISHLLCQSKRDWRAHEIALAELDPALAQDVVGGGAVEIEIRQRVGEQQRLAGELARRPARERDLDRLVLAAVDLRGLEAFEEIDRLGDAILELRNGRLGVGETRQVRAGEPAAGV